MSRDVRELKISMLTMLVNNRTINGNPETITEMCTATQNKMVSNYCLDIICIDCPFAFKHNSLLLSEIIGDNL